jgi:hypothetical protein
LQELEVPKATTTFISIYPEHATDDPVKLFRCRFKRNRLQEHLPQGLAFQLDRWIGYTQQLLFWSHQEKTPSNLFSAEQKNYAMRWRIQ